MVTCFTYFYKWWGWSQIRWIVFLKYCMTGEVGFEKERDLQIVIYVSSAAIAWPLSMFELTCRFYICCWCVKEEHGSGRGEILIVIPDKLKPWLVDDMDLVNHQKQVSTCQSLSNISWQVWIALNAMLQACSKMVYFALVSLAGHASAQDSDWARAGGLHPV